LVELVGLEIIAVEWCSSCCEVNESAMPHRREGFLKSEREEQGQDDQGRKGGQPPWSLSPEEIGKYVMILLYISPLRN
jgi:hypothetical protein